MLQHERLKTFGNMTVARKDFNLARQNHFDNGISAFQQLYLGSLRDARNLEVPQ